MMATAIALWKRQQGENQTMVLMPPILVRQWKNWIDSLNGPITALMYKGTPAARQKLDLNHDFLLMSIQIFKKDYERLLEWFANRPVTLIVDEAVSIKNPGSANYKAVRDFING